MTRRRPLIGITTRHELETERFYLGRDYSEAVEAAGGLPVLIPLLPRAEFIQDLVEEVDAVLLAGSASDVDPLLYGQEPHTRLGPVHPLRDETDLLVLKRLEERSIPLLAICFGMQSLNVSRGGTLIQDITAQVPEPIKHEQGVPRGRRSHVVKFLKESLAQRLNGEGRLPVNSHHHQAVKTLGADLRATAWSGDGLIEAIEDTREGRWVQGVQWHPEIDWASDNFSRALFSAFVEAAGRK